ncbi:MAG: hypothetical protein H8E17_12640 [Deltaproteobacteria bacterium]|nr:hypothetical protein [Deltaproteobacteria bacterium]
MIKVLFIECCGDCKYFILTINKCWHSEAEHDKTLDSLTFPDWCPLPNATVHGDV